MNPRGKFIVIYGVNNLGKTAQIKHLKENLLSVGYCDEVKLIKYPIYDLEPTGPLINAVFREGLPMSDYDLQKLTVANRFHYEHQLMNDLNSGTWVIAEDYVVTGIAWSMVKGIPIEEAEEWNRGLYLADVSVLLDGERFISGIEREHRYEAGGDWLHAREAHLALATRYGIDIVNANLTEEEVSQEIFRVVENKLS